MTSFKLERKSTGRVLTNFKVTDDKGAVYGSINVPNEAVSDLLKHWKETTPAPRAASKQSTAAAAFERGLQASETAKIEQAGDFARLLTLAHEKACAEACCPRRRSSFDSRSVQGERDRSIVGQALSAVPRGNRLLAAGSASPYRALSEVPERLLAFVGEPPELSQLPPDLEAEQILNSFGPVSEEAFFAHKRSDNSGSGIISENRRITC